MKKPRTVHIKEDTWYALGGFVEDVCCDCGLHHLTQYKLEDGQLFFKAVRDDRSTRKYRKENGISVKKAK